MTISHAKFTVGQLVSHKLFNYRGVIVDVDPEFEGSDEWYRQVAQSRPPKDQPWYHVLVDQAVHSTYVAERNLESDSSGEPIEHPLMSSCFRGMENGRYLPERQGH